MSTLPLLPLHGLISTTVSSSDSRYSPVVTYYEVLRRVSDGYLLGTINPTTGAMVVGCKALDYHGLVGLAFIQPDHPVYEIWQRRRLADILEGLDRS